MKRIASILTGLALTTLLFVAPAHALSEGHSMIANIPFQFTVESTSLPAGQYEFLCIEVGGKIVQIRDVDGHNLDTVITSITTANKVDKKSTLTFSTVNGRHVLTQIWNEPAGIHYEFQSVHTDAESAEHPANHETVTALR